jgi:hypothetical protein
LCDQLKPGSQQMLPPTASFDHRGFQPKLRAPSP